MSAFSNGFNFGFATGMFNRMFGGFMPFGGFCQFGGFNPFWGGNFFDGFNCFSMFNFMPPSFPPMNFNFSNQSFISNSVFANYTGGGYSFPAMDVFTPSITYTPAPAAKSAPVSAPRKEDVLEFSYDAEALKNRWKNKKPNLSNAFYNKVVDIAMKINCNPDDLMALMNAESGLDSKAVNDASRATGLIQFMPDTASDYGITVEQLAAMTPEQQLVYVEKYLVRAKKGAGLGNQKLDAATLYALVFLPKYAKSEVLTREGERAYSWNPALDRDGDKAITKRDLAAWLNENRA